MDVTGASTVLDVAPINVCRMSSHSAGGPPFIIPIVSSVCVGCTTIDETMLTTIDASASSPRHSGHRSSVNSTF